MKKHLLIILMVVALFMVTGCEDKPKEQNNNEQGEKQDNNQESNTNSNTNTTNQQDNEERIVVEEVINCDGCVWAYFTDNRDFGSTVLEGEYSSDINDIKTKAGNQRHNFFGFNLTDNKIMRAYSCILKDNKIYCIEGTTGGEKHEANVAILNKIFTTDQCKYISDGHTYTCTDGHYNGTTKTDGYANLHYETSCSIVKLSSGKIRMNCS